MVKWKDRSMEDSTWMDEAMLEQADHSVENFMSSYSQYFLQNELLSVAMLHPSK